MGAPEWQALRRSALKRPHSRWREAGPANCQPLGRTISLTSWPPSFEGTILVSLSYPGRWESSTETARPGTKPRNGKWQMGSRGGPHPGQGLAIRAHYFLHGWRVRKPRIGRTEVVPCYCLSVIQRREKSTIAGFAAVQRSLHGTYPALCRGPQPPIGHATFNQLGR